MSTTLKGLRKLLDKATPGIWVNNPVYECVHSSWEDCKLKPIVHYSHNNPVSKNDAELIAAAINSLPALIAIAEAAQRVSLYDWTDGTDDDANADMRALHDAVAALLFRCKIEEIVK